MRIEINPKSLKNLEQICEVTYKLHPIVLNEMVDIQRSLGKIIGKNNENNLSLEQRELIIDNTDYHFEIEDTKDDDDFKEMVNILHGDGEYSEDIFVFNRLLKYLQLDTYEYIPIKIFIEIEDSVIGRKIKELIRTLENTKAPEQFYLTKREIDYDAYFSEGYGLTMNEEQRKKKDKLFSKKDLEELKKLLIKEKLYYY